jgi:hypothetical protein
MALHRGLLFAAALSIIFLAGAGKRQSNIMANNTQCLTWHWTFGQQCRFGSLTNALLSQTQARWE